MVYYIILAVVALILIYIAPMVCDYVDRGDKEGK
jgi:hypothetical protein